MHSSRKIVTETIRPRVLIVSPHLTRTLGGITALVREIIASDLAAIYDFKQIASQADEYSQFGKFLLAIVAFIQYALTIFAWRPQLVIIHVGGNASLYRKAPFIALGRLTGRRVLAHFHAGDFDLYFHQQSRCGQRLILWGLGQSHQLITCSSQLGRILKEHLPQSEPIVMPNAIETAAFKTQRHTVGREAGAPVRLLFAGAMGRFKGERDLVQAIQKISQDVPHLRAFLLGHGAETVADLCRETGVQQRLDYFGPAQMHDRIDFFRRADFFVLPTYAEGMPVSVIEALAAGLPVITTPVGGIPDLITDGVEGFLVQPGDVNGLAEKITLLATDEKLRRTMGERAELKARQFDRHIVLTQLDEVLRKSLSLQWSAPPAVADGQEI